MSDSIVGQPRVIYRTILDDGVATDPATLQVEVERPNGDIDTFVFGVDAALTNPSVGYYELVYTPATPGTFNYRWETTDPDTVGEGSFLVGASALDQPQLIIGPCEPWVAADDVAEYLGSQWTGGTDLTPLDLYAAIASDVFFQISSAAYPGECGPKVVRPCADGCSCWGRVLQRVGTDPTSTIVAWNPGTGYWSCAGRSCGCDPISEVHLTGSPRTIVEVKIDGVAVPDDEYRLDPGGRLVRLRDPLDPDSTIFWPACQIIDLDDTEEGTFSIEYTYGLDPPAAGREAAKALAAQMWLARNNSGRCKLPANTKAVVRGGQTIELGGLIAESIKRGATGIIAIDTFVAAHVQLDVNGNPVEASVVWSPDLPAFPRRVG